MRHQRALRLLPLLLLATGIVLTGCDDRVGPMGARPKATPSLSASTGSSAVDPGPGWTRVPPAPLSPRQGLQLVILGDGIVAVRRSHARGVAADRVYDPADRSWASLPLAPTAPTDERAAVTADGELVVLGEPRDDPSDDDRGARVMAAYQPDTATWRRIPDPPVVGAVTSWGGAWSAIDELIVSDSGRGGSSPLPAPMPTPRGGGLAEPHTTWADASPTAILARGWLLCPDADGPWTPIPANPALPDDGHATVLLGQRLLVWGGGAWSGDRDLSAQGWMWTPATG